MLNTFDLPIMRVLQGSDSIFLDDFIVVCTSASTWIPLYIALIYMVIKNNESMKQIAVTIGFAVLMVGVMAYIDEAIVKPLVMRPRPMNDPLLKYTIDIACGYRAKGYSFFSAHSANTMCIAVFFSLLVRSKWLAVVLGSWTLLNGFTRIYLGAHYPSDVLVGFVSGAVMGCLFYYLWFVVDQKTEEKVNLISDKYTDGGYAYQEINIVILTYILTLLYALFHAAVQF